MKLRTRSLVVSFKAVLVVIVGGVLVAGTGPGLLFYLAPIQLFIIVYIILDEVENMIDEREDGTAPS